MMDVKLISKAEEKSKTIEQIDFSWRAFVRSLKENNFTIPFKGSYQALLENDVFLVEGYCGLLLVDKLYFKHQTYLLKEPVKYYPFRIYGVYDQRGSFEHFVARPEMGFHYLGMSNHGHMVCTGDIQYQNPDSLELLKEACLKIINSFRVVNLESLGTVLLPDEYATLRSILSNKDEEAKTKIGKLLRQELIEELL